MEPADHPADLLRKIGRELEQQTRHLTVVRSYLAFLVFVTGVGLIIGVLVAVVGVN
jgi:hypothetical protein